MASYCYGLSKTALKYKTIPQVLDERAANTPKKTAYIFHLKMENENIVRSSVTFEELAQRSELVAAGLLKLGIRSGDHVGIMANNSPGYLYVDCACLKIKALLIRILKELLDSCKLCTFLQKHKVSTLVIDRNNGKTLQKMFPGFLKLETRTTLGLGHIEKVLLVEDCTLFRPATNPALDMDVQQVKDIQKTCDPDDVAIMFSTSGSTGLPKCVLHSHFGHINVLSYYNDEEMVLFTLCTFNWSSGLVYGPIVAGITLVYVDDSIYNIQDEVCYQIMEDECVNTCSVIPALLFKAKRRQEEGIRTFPSGRKIHITGELISSDLEIYMQHQFDECRSVYGSAEMFHTLDTMGKDTLRWHFPLPNVEAKITDDNGQVVPRETVGNLKIRSPYTLVTYLGTDSVKDNAGWFTTNDLAKMDEGGRIMILGRNNDIISKDACIIHPKAIEDLLLDHPNVEKAAVVPVPDPTMFQESCAFILAKPGSKLTKEDLWEFCSVNTFDNSHLMTPKFIKILDGFPYGSTGKLDRAKLKQLASDLFGVFSE